MDLFDRRHIDPMLIAEERPAFDDPDWIFELKWDGSRTLAYLDPDASGPYLTNKRHKNLTPGFPELKDLHRQVKGRCILDGELFVYDDAQKKVDFAEMQRRSLMSNPFKINLAAAKQPVTFVAFDLLYHDGEELFFRPLTERKEMLAATVNETERFAVARFIDGNGTGLYQLAEQQGLEGIVAKRKSSIYIQGKRTRHWIKCKNQLDEDFLVCGYFFKGEHGNVTSVILGSYTPSGTLIYRGHVVLGVSRSDFQRMKQQPVTGKLPLYESFPVYPDTVWIEPKLVCTVRFMEYTAHGGLRQPVYKGLRDDKAPQECVKR